MRRRGYALLPVLWVMVLMGSVALLDAHEADISIRATRNRLLAHEAWWARRACESAVLSRISGQVQQRERGGPQGLSLSWQLGSGRGCETAVRDNGTVLNVNTADSALLSCVFGLAGADRILRSRPLPSADAIPLLTGPVGPSLVGVVGIRGPNRFNINEAPLTFLGCLPEVEPSVLAAIGRYRQGRHRIENLAELSEALDPAARRRFLETLAVGQTRLLTDAPSWDVVVRGRAGVPPLVSELVLEVVERGREVELLAVQLP